MQIGEKVKKGKNPKRIVKPIPADIPKPEEVPQPVRVPLQEPKRHAS
jgi:hypothetical protein